MVVAAVTTVVVFNRVCMEGSDFKILRHLQAFQENVVGILELMRERERIYQGVHVGVLSTQEYMGPEK